jgi:hypothetical protein
LIREDHEEILHLTDGHSLLFDLAAGQDEAHPLPQTGDVPTESIVAWNHALQSGLDAVVPQEPLDSETLARLNSLGHVE